MQQEKAQIRLDNSQQFIAKLIYWASQFQCCSVLYQQKKVFVAVDAMHDLTITNNEDVFTEIENFHKKHSSNCYGYISYDVKNQIENLHSNHSSSYAIPLSFFFIPRYEFIIEEDEVIINRSTLEALALLDLIQQLEIPVYQKQHFNWKSSIQKKEYIAKIEQIRSDIKEGTVYELNLSRELSTDVKELDAAGTFIQVQSQVKAPHAAFVQFKEIAILSFSPERFMIHQNGKIKSQPIKGTIKKTEDAALNEQLKNDLYTNEKERAENVMIVDLVRNDFTKFAKTGSIKVDELFGIYEFENIIQMISTISATLIDKKHAIDALKAAFPMGSMTGAPKVKAMELIECYENRRRNIYSGTIGRIAANGDFDFNVVIRTLIYNTSKHSLSFHVGGAITYDSNALNEWIETETKANSILNYL